MLKEDFDDFTCTRCDRIMSVVEKDPVYVEFSDMFYNALDQLKAMVGDKGWGPLSDMESAATTMAGLSSHYGYRAGLKDGAHLCRELGLIEGQPPRGRTDCK